LLIGKLRPVRASGGTNTAECHIPLHTHTHTHTRTHTSTAALTDTLAPTVMQLRGLRDLAVT